MDIIRIDASIKSKRSQIPFKKIVPEKILGLYYI
jgi:hypothetical protein